MSSRSPLNTDSFCAIGEEQMELGHGSHFRRPTASAAISQTVTKLLLIPDDEDLARTRARRDGNSKEGQCAEESPARGKIEMYSLPTNSRDVKTTTFSFSKVGATL